MPGALFVHIHIHIAINPVILIHIGNICPMRLQKACFPGAYQSAIAFMYHNHPAVFCGISITDYPA